MTSYKLRKWWLLIFLLSFLLSSCTGLNIAAGDQTIIVNRDLSGTISRSIALSPIDYNQVRDYTDLSDPSEYIAQDLAEVLGWSSYTSDYWQEDGYEWISVTAEFSSPEELYELMRKVSSDISIGSGGAAGAAGELNDEDFPPFSLSKTERLFYTEYRMEGTLIALAATGASMNKSTFHAQLPGRIIEEETNGQIMPDGETVVWNWGRYDYVPHYHVTRTTRFSRVFGAMMLFGLCAINVMGGLGFWFWRRQSHAGLKSPGW